MELSYVQVGSLLLLSAACSPLGATADRTDRPPPCAVVASVQVSEGFSASPIRRAQNLLRKSPNSQVHLEHLGWAFVAAARSSHDPGWYKLAEMAALCMEQVVPRAPAALLLRGHALHSLHRFAEAEALGRELVERRGAWSDHALMGDALMEQGRLEQAALSYQKMLDLRPGPEAYSRGAHLRWLRGDIEGAIRLMERAAHASGVGAAEATAWIYTRLAAYETQRHNLARARDLCDSALALLPGYAPALLARGRVHLANGRFEAAVSDLRQAERSSPLPDYRWALIEALGAAGLHSEAEVVEESLLGTGAADDPRTFALYLATRGLQSELAVALAERELQQRGDVFSHDALAWALAAAGKLAEATREIELALRAGTRDARIFLHAAAITAAQAGPSGAGEWCARAWPLAATLLPSERKLLTRVCSDDSGRGRAPQAEAIEQQEEES